MFGKKKAENNATAAKCVASDKKHERMSVGKWRDDRGSRANDDDIDAWEQEREDVAAGRGDEEANLRRYKEAFLQITTFAPQVLL